MLRVTIMYEEYQQLIDLVVAEGKVNLETATLNINILTIQEVELGISWFAQRAEFGDYILPPSFLAAQVRTCDVYLSSLRSKIGYGAF